MLRVFCTLEILDIYVEVICVFFSLLLKIFYQTKKFAVPLNNNTNIITLDILE